MYFVSQLNYNSKPQNSALVSKVRFIYVAILRSCISFISTGISYVYFNLLRLLWRDMVLIQQIPMFSIRRYFAF